MPAEAGVEQASPAEAHASQVVRMRVVHEPNELDEAVRSITGVVGASLAGVSRAQGHYGGRVLTGEAATQLRYAYSVIAHALHRSHQDPGALREQLIARSALRQIAQALAGRSKNPQQARASRAAPASPTPVLFFDDPVQTQTHIASVVPGLRQLNLASGVSVGRPGFGNTVEMMSSEEMPDPVWSDAPYMTSRMQAFICLQAAYTQIAIVDPGTALGMFVESRSDSNGRPLDPPGGSSDESRPEARRVLLVGLRENAVINFANGGFMVLHPLLCTVRDSHFRLKNAACGHRILCRQCFERRHPEPLPGQTLGCPFCSQTHRNQDFEDADAGV